MSDTSQPLALPPSSIIGILRCISFAAPMIPFPGVEAAVKIVISILEVVESVHTSKEDCVILAEKAAQLVLSLHTGALSLEVDSMTYENIQRNIEPFGRILEDIEEYTSTLSKLAWVKQAWKRRAIAERIQKLSRNLDVCFQSFQLTSFVRLEALAAQFKDEQSVNFDQLHQDLIKAAEDSTIRITSEIQAVGSFIGRVEDNRRYDTQELCHLLKEICVNVDKEPRHDHPVGGWVIALRELAPIRVYLPRTLDHGGITFAKYRGDNVIVKRYLEEKKFVEEKNSWKDIWHPYLPQIIGHSSESERSPFIVLRGDIVTNDIKSFIQQSLEKNTVIGLMDGLEILYGISSAINYLRTEGILSTKELLGIIQPCNIQLSSHNRVPLGENLIARMSSKRHVIECHRDAEMDVYLSHEFFDACMEILALNNRFTPLEVSSGQGPYSILRLLMSFSSFGRRGRTMNKVAARIERAWLELNTLKQNMGQLTFSDIRRILLNINDLPHARSYTPREDWDISTGDIGYVRYGKFIRLENILISSGFSVAETEVLQITCDPPRECSKESLEDGWTRYEFISPLHAWFWHSGRCDMDIAEATAVRELITLAPRYLEKYKQHSLALTDIILITNKETRPRRWAEFFYHSSDDGNDNPPEKVYFFMKAAINGTSEEAWGYWSINPIWVEMPRGSASNITDPRISCQIVELPKIFEFVQLEKEDAETCLTFSASAN